MSSPKTSVIVVEVFMIAPVTSWAKLSTARLIFTVMTHNPPAQLQYMLLMIAIHIEGAIMHNEKGNAIYLRPQWVKEWNALSAG